MAKLELEYFLRINDIFLGLENWEVIGFSYKELFVFQHFVSIVSEGSDRGGGVYAPSSFLSWLSHFKNHNRKILWLLMYRNSKDSICFMHMVGYRALKIPVFKKNLNSPFLFVTKATDLKTIFWKVIEKCRNVCHALIFV